MHLSDIHFAVAKSSNDKVTVLYIGPDSRKADEAYYSAKKVAEVARGNLSAVTCIRYPIQEDEQAKFAADAGARATEAEKTKALQAAASKREQASKLLAEAEKLHPTAQPETQPSSSSSAPAKSETEPAPTDNPVAEQETE